MIVLGLLSAVLGGILPNIQCERLDSLVILYKDVYKRQVLGGFVFGTLSDKYGRVRVLTWTIVLFAVFTGLCAFAQGYWDLLIYRTIAGIGLGLSLIHIQMCIRDSHLPYG